MRSYILSTRICIGKIAPINNCGPEGVSADGEVSGEERRVRVASGLGVVDVQYVARKEGRYGRVRLDANVAANQSLLPVLAICSIRLPLPLPLPVCIVT